MLKQLYENKADIPAEYVGLYTEKDGKFVLTGIEGMKTQDDVDSVQGALRRERELKRELQAKIDAYDGIDSAGLRESLDELARLRTTGGKIDDSKIEDIVAERLKLDKSKHERDLEALQTKNTELLSVNTNLVNEKNKTLIEKSLRDAAKGKVSESAMNDVLFRASMFEVSEDGNVLTRDGMGVTPGQDPVKWIDETLTNNTHWQKTSSGAGARGNVGGSSTNPTQGPKPIKDIVTESVTFN